jgi:triacylglycerol lipase
MNRRSFSLVVMLSCVAGLHCAPVEELDEPLNDEELVGTSEQALTVGLTTHFRTWLTNSGYSSYNFARDDLSGGSYGGKTGAADTVVNQPVIFIHGNSDMALGETFGQTGWTDSIEYFTANGYKSSEMYATTWGPADVFASSQQYHSKAHVMKVRKFIEAVLAYTGAAKVDVIAHSMGVTLARKAIKGGTANDSLGGGSYSVGSFLTAKIDTFVSIAGANRGLTSCYQSGPTTPTCGSTNGLYPGYWNGIDVSGRSAFLNDLLATSSYEGSFRYAIHSSADEVIGYGGLVYGQYTARIPGQTGEVMFSASPYGHFNSKDLTGYNQWRMVKFHQTN